MKTVFILLDSLNRRFLSCYPASESAVTPNIDRLARRAVVFDNHWCGSSPCMPARRDILTGRLNFLERPWGGVEPFDHTLPALLGEHQVYTHMETDHFHYAERGGENYWGHFTSWRLHRGTEDDTINWGPGPDGIPAPCRPDGYVGSYSDPYERTRQLYGGRKDNYSTPRTFNAATEWLKKYHDADNFMLWVEGFDPHEPFDVPDEFMALYDGPAAESNDAYWPEYTTADQYTPAQIAHFRRRYKALISMTDQYVGKLLDVLDQYNMWEDTMVVLTTDHGYMLGEHGFLAKCYMPDYNEVHHIPLLIAAPGVAPRRCGALTENIDLFPTFLENYEVPLSRCRNPIHGKSLWPLLRGVSEKLRDELIFGVFAKTVNIYDGRYLYMRRTVSETNEPLYIYGATMTLLGAYIGYDTMSREDIESIEMGRFLPWTNYPVYRVPAAHCHWDTNAASFKRINEHVPRSMLFDLKTDYAQQRPLSDSVLEMQMAEKLRRAMAAHDSPAEQYERLGL